MTSLDQHQSVYRERLLEHLLISQLLKHAWLHEDAGLEVARGEVDRSGYDVVLEANGVIRHVQLKTSSVHASTARQTVHRGLMTKPSGCVVWSLFDPKDLQLGPFLFYGSEPRLPLPSIDHFAVARHAKGNSKGVKTERPNLRVVPRQRFERIATVEGLYARLFSPTGGPA